MCKHKKQMFFEQPSWGHGGDLRCGGVLCVNIMFCKWLDRAKPSFGEMLRGGWWFAIRFVAEIEGYKPVVEYKKNASTCYDPKGNTFKFEEICNSFKLNNCVFGFDSSCSKTPRRMDFRDSVLTSMFGDKSSAGDPCQPGPQFVLWESVSFRRTSS